MKPIPTQAEIAESEFKCYYYGYYITDDEIREFSIKHNKNRVDTSMANIVDYAFLTDFCTALVDADSGRRARLRPAYVRPSHKEADPQVEELADGTVLVLVLLTSEEYYEQGLKPSHREVLEMTKLLELSTVKKVKKKLCWWEAAQDEDGCSAQDED